MRLQKRRDLYINNYAEKVRSHFPSNKFTPTSLNLGIKKTITNLPKSSKEEIEDN